MEVPAAGMGASGLDRTPAPPILPVAHLPALTGSGVPVSADTVATLFSDLSQAGWLSLMEIVEAPLRTADAAHIDELLQAMGESVASENTARALDLLRQVVTLSPERAETVSTTPQLAAIRPAIEQLLSQVTSAARLRAEGRVAEAAARIETDRLGYSGEIKPEILISLAEKLIAAGGLANYVRSEAVSGTLLDPARWIPTTIEQIAPRHEPPRVWRVSLRLVIALWASLGLAAIALCGWLRVEYVDAVAVVWAAGMLVLLLVRAWRTRNS